MIFVFKRAINTIFTYKQSYLKRDVAQSKRECSTFESHAVLRLTGEMTEFTKPTSWVTLCQTQPGRKVTAAFKSPGFTDSEISCFPFQVIKHFHLYF